MFLTSPFIDQAFALKTPDNKRNRDIRSTDDSLRGGRSFTTRLRESDITSNHQAIRVEGSAWDRSSSLGGQGRSWRRM